jgi:hypothetical protein
MKPGLMPGFVVSWPISCPTVRKWPEAGGESQADGRLSSGRIAE